jgi:hypothetical protein
VNKAIHLTELIATLGRHAQRATYAAVGGVVGLPARSVMKGREITPENAWVVSKKYGLPTGYASTDLHPHLQSYPQVISTHEALVQWLRSHV